MNDYIKPLPQQVKGVVSRKYWDSLKEEKFMYQKCNDCDVSIFYARVICPNCMSENLSWHQSAGKGTIYSYTTVFRTGAPGFTSEVPYVVGLVDLAEGIRVMANIIGWDDPEALQIDQAVQIEFQKATDEFTLPVFRVIKEEKS